MNSELNSIKDFISGFFKRKGGYVFSAIIINRVFGFVLSLFVINFLTKSEFGSIAYAYNIISFITPFAGFGIFQSLNRYGAIQDSQTKKQQLFKFVFYRGIIASIVLVLLIIVLAPLLVKTLPNSYNYLLQISVLIINLFILEMVKIYYRIYNINKLFAYIEISQSVVLLVSGLLLTYFLGGTGYVLALVFSPLVVAVYIIVKNKMLLNITNPNYSKSLKKSIWSYGIYTSMGGLVSQLIFSVDILTIGFIIKNPDSVALYKAASLIPMALLFIPSGVMKTDLIKITQQYKNKIFLKKYAANYIKLFSIISIALLIILHFSTPIILSFFGEQYSEIGPLITVFAIGLVGAFIFRIPFGNIITAVGWAKTNTLISCVVLVLDVLLNIYFVDEYGIIGAAYSTTILLWISGLLSYLAFRNYLSKLD